MRVSQLWRRVAGAGLAFGLAASNTDSPIAPPSDGPVFGEFPTTPGANPGQVDFEFFEICKSYDATTPLANRVDVTFNVSVDKNSTGTVDETFPVTLSDGECQDIWTDGGTDDDLVTVQEMVPPGFVASYVVTTLERFQLGGEDDREVTGPVVLANTASQAFHGNALGTVGVLVEFTNIPSTTGRMTGGGGQIQIDGARITRGFTIHCDIVLSNNLEINWPGGNKWHITKPLTDALCLDDPNFDPFPPAAPFDTFIGEGTGSLNGVAGSIVKFTFIDNGEPGKTDQATIQIWASGADPSVDIPVLDVFGVLDHGNIQAHFDQPHK